MRSLPSATLIGTLCGELLAQVLGALTGGWVGARVAGWAPFAHATVIGALRFVAGLGHTLIVWHPAWFWVADLSVYVPAA
jgi:hypothetical protein